MEYGENARVSLFFSNKVLAVLQNISKIVFEEKSVPQNTFMQKKMTSEEFFTLYKDIYKFWFGRITNMDRVLMWYPEYLRKITRVMHHVMQAEGPLPLDWRYFLAIIVTPAHLFDFLMVAIIECELL